MGKPISDIQKYTRKQQQILSYVVDGVIIGISVPEYPL